MRMTPARRRTAWAATIGVVSAGALLAAAELVAVLLARNASVLLAIGAFVIDVVPRPLKELAITTLGTADKPVLLVGVAVAAGVAAALAGVLEVRRPGWGAAAFVVGAALATAAAVTRAGTGALAWVPPVVGGAVGVGVLVLLARLLRRADAPEPADPPTDASPGIARRSFLRATAIASVSAVLVGAGAAAARLGSSAVGAVREALRLPAPRSRVAVPGAAQLDIPGLSPLITSNADFYRVDTALSVPRVDPSTWRLTIDGLVERPVELGFDELVAMGLDEYAITLTCVSNEVGGDLVDTAIWLGVPVREVLRLAGPRAGADMVLSRSVDGFTASTPLASLTDDGLDAILAVGMNGEPLPLEHGFPVRMVVPGLYGYVSATKWLTELRVTTFADDEAYWTPRGYSATAPIKLSSRVDTPKLGAAVAAGRVPIAGVAWAQTVGIARVEVRIDDGDWQDATLAEALADDTWVQWVLEWDAEPGTHYLTVRATDRAGTLQTEEPAPIAPDGSTGWQRTLVTVTEAG
ncbi:molybdopterin-dependent oxidoreductase [Agromyces chitinivorans]|uniref:molybdopterin-dependent oxidoreductase n=1 Tax=Agromyces chitinivorans TaxID=3158560 RepID=UPI003F516DF0